MIKDFQYDFPVLKDYVYLNTASCGLISESLVNWRREHDNKLMHGGSLYRDLHKNHIKEIRATVGRFFETKDENVALVPNFSFGWNVLLEGLGESEKILLLKGEYPSVCWPVESKNIDYYYAEMGGDLETNIIDAIEKYKPTVFAFSMIQYISGLRMDMNFLKRLKEEYPNLLLMADGTQFFGTTNFNFSESPIDVMGGSCYKWMLSGYGNAVFLFQPRVKQRISPKTIGFNSADAAYSKRNEIDFIGYFEPGHQDALNYGSIEQSIKFMETIGKDEIEKHLSRIRKLAQSEFLQMGLLDENLHAQKEHSTIFNLRGDEKLFNRLKEHKIIASLRGKGIRVGFHFYNNENHLDALLSCLKKSN